MVDIHISLIYNITTEGFEVLDIKTSIELKNEISQIGKIGEAYPGKELISENTFVIYNYDEKDNYNTLYGFKNSTGKIIVDTKYPVVTAFKDGLAWVFNENDVPILLNKRGKEVLYSKNALEYGMTKDFKLLEKEKKEYLKSHKAYAKKHKFEDDASAVYTFKNKKKFGLKRKDNTIILPAEYDDIYVDGDIIVINDKMYNVHSIKPIYEVTISYDDLSVTETFNTYNDMKNYISKFKKEFESNLLLIHEEFENVLKEIQSKKKKDTTKLFYDSDKKVQSEVLKYKKGKK